MKKHMTNKQRIFGDYIEYLERQQIVAACCDLVGHRKERVDTILMLIKAFANTPEALSMFEKDIHKIIKSTKIKFQEFGIETDYPNELMTFNDLLQQADIEQEKIDRFVEAEKKLYYGEEYKTVIKEEDFNDISFHNENIAAVEIGALPNNNNDELSVIVSKDMEVENGA